MVPLQKPSRSILPGGAEPRGGEKKRSARNVKIAFFSALYGVDSKAISGDIGREGYAKGRLKKELSARKGQIAIFRDGYGAGSKAISADSSREG